MAFHCDELHSFADLTFDLDQPQTDIYQKFEPPPRWDSFRNRIMTDEQAAQKVRDDAAAAAAKQRRKSRFNPKFYSKDLSHAYGNASPILDMIKPSLGDAILDIGCGDGALTASLANRVPLGTLVGMDSSADMIQHASTTHTASRGNLVFIQHECTRLDEKPEDMIMWDGAWDWVFSNSTFHWLLRHQDTRATLFEDIYRLLKPGGKLVFECGGAGSVPEGITALVAAMAFYGVDSETRKQVNPWWFPSAEWTREALETAGFEVLECKTHHQPNKVSVHDGSLEAWVRQLGAVFLDAIEPEEGPRRDQVVRWVCEVLDDSIERKEDGTRWLSYVRLRVLAKKKRMPGTTLSRATKKGDAVMRLMCEKGEWEAVPVPLHAGCILTSLGALLPGRMSKGSTSFSFM